MNEILTKLDYVNLLVVSIIVTLVVSAMKISFENYFKGHRVKILSFIVAIHQTTSRCSSFSNGPSAWPTSKSSSR